MSPFGLFIGRLFNPSPALKPLLDGYSELQVPDAQAVCALGEVDLGEAVQLKRFYLDDEDYWLQVLMNGNEVGDTVLFGYHSAIPVRDEYHLQQVVGSQSSVGMPIYEHDGYLYSRQWGREQGKAPLVSLHEQVVNQSARYGISHLSMLYARDTGLPERREFLLLSIEEDEQGSLTFTTSLGATLFPSDFHVT